MVTRGKPAAMQVYVPPAFQPGGMSEPATPNTGLVTPPPPSTLPGPAASAPSPVIWNKHPTPVRGLAGPQFTSTVSTRRPWLGAGPPPPPPPPPVPPRAPPGPPAGAP